MRSHSLLPHSSTGSLWVSDDSWQWCDEIVPAVARAAVRLRLWRSNQRVRRRTESPEINHGRTSWLFDHLVLSEGPPTRSQSLSRREDPGPKAVPLGVSRACGAKWKDVVVRSRRASHEGGMQPMSQVALMHCYLPTQEAAAHIGPTVRATYHPAATDRIPYRRLPGRRLVSAMQAIDRVARTRRGSLAGRCTRCVSRGRE